MKVAVTLQTRLTREFTKDPTQKWLPKMCPNLCSRMRKRCVRRCTGGEQVKACAGHLRTAQHDDAAQPLCAV